ncbi:MAG: HD domain-containing protein [Gemmatimonadetes bacterium]|nr:HD domain-containing protein [Gemmatimonadota bacterium]
MLHFELLRTRVARRILLLFVVGALAPVVVLAGYSFTVVTAQLRDQSRDRLQQLSKNAGMSVIERLQDAEVDLEMAADEVAVSGRLRSILEVVVAAAGELPPGTRSMAAFRDGEWQHLRAGKALLRLDDVASDDADLWLARLREPADPESPVVWGRLDTGYLWSSADEYVDLPSVGGFCILAGVTRRLHCADGFAPGVSEGLIEAFRISPVSDGRGVFQWSSDGESYVGSHWELFLRAGFQSEPWSVLVGESESVVYAPLRRFALAFPPVLLFGLIVVALLANGLVRRTMEPLESLTQGTRSIASKDFDTRVVVDRDDEFGELAGAFNTMAERLGVQFRHLEASRAIDQAVLSASHRDQVVRALLNGFGGVVAYDRLAILLLERDQRTGSMHWMDEDDGRSHDIAVQPSAAEVAYLAEAGPHVVSGDGESLPEAVRSFLDDVRPALVLPLMVKHEVRGALVVGRRRAFGPEEVVRARQIVDQAAVALDEVQLVTELEELSWGTLRALARAIDAKSRWTAGHSERVARLAMDIGREMGLSERELDTLERGGLLHDVGKIGIPAAVLDCEGPLSDEQRDIMRQHVVIGARILEPVGAYADAIPIVLHHHERWDGEGYPHGLAGEEIPLLARVLSVADTFDAMSSLRPYRSPEASERVVRHIEEASGTQFEPRVVAAFLRVRKRTPGARLAAEDAAEDAEVARHG